MDKEVKDKVIEAHRDCCNYLNSRTQTCKDDIGNMPCAADCKYMSKFIHEIEDL